MFMSIHETISVLGVNQKVSSREVRRRHLLLAGKILSAWVVTKMKEKKTTMRGAIDNT